MPLFVIGLLVIFVMFAIASGRLAPPHARTLIRVRDGQVRIARGHLPSRACQFVSDILHEAGVSRGYIAVVSEQSVAFSKTIPASVHQRLRNVLLNQ
jgi:hypothetical protein